MQNSWNVIFQKVIILVTVSVQLQKLNEFGGFINKVSFKKFNLYRNYTFKSNVNLEKKWAKYHSYWFNIYIDAYTCFKKL